jgi:hypothetical protein
MSGDSDIGKEGDVRNGLGKNTRRITSKVVPYKKLAR